MENTTTENNEFDATQSLRTISEILQVSQKRIKNDGILFIVWGYVNFYTYFIEYLQQKSFYLNHIGRQLDTAARIFGIGAILFTIVYIFQQRRKVQTYIGVSLRYVWISLVVCLVLINLIQFNVMHEINFNLQHPIFMVIIAFATLITGVLLRFKLIIIGGALFGLLAFVSSYFQLEDQLLMEAIAWLAAFIIPGHILFSKRNS